MGKEGTSGFHLDSQLFYDQGGENKPVKKPFLVRWRGGYIATRDIHEFPDAVHVSRLLTVPKDKLNVRSIFDPSELNSFCGPPKRSSIHKRMHRAHLYLRRVNLSPRPASRVEPSGWRKGTSWLVRLSLLCSVRVTWAYSYLRVLLPYAFLKGG